MASRVVKISRNLIDSINEGEIAEIIVISKFESGLVEIQSSCKENVETLGLIEYGKNIYLKHKEKACQKSG